MCKLCQNMKVAHINLSDNSGGASIAMMRLHSAMKDAGIDSKVFVVRYTLTNDKDVFPASVMDRKIWSSARYLIAKHKEKKATIPNKGLFSIQSGHSSLLNPKNFVDFDAIYIHWVGFGTMNNNALKKILQLNRPVFWVCHDMYPFTGGCHHSYGCERFYDDCGFCPLLKNPSAKDISFRALQNKYKIYSQFPNLQFIAISPYMQNLLKSAKLSKDHYIHLIPNTLDTRVFCVKTKDNCRKKFGLPQGKLLILFGADMGVKNPYKGWDYARNVINKLSEKYKEGIELVVFGSDYSEEIEKQLNVKINFLGKINNPNDMVDVYNASDIYLNPSIAESFSYTTCEAISCGVPTVAFDIGGIPSIIDHLFNGYLAEQHNINELIKGIEWAIELVNDKTMKEDCHKTIVQKFDSKIIAQKHLELLQNFVHCGI